jgi:plastocyanin
MGSTGSGATHTVIVAPSQGVLRYVPFALNASVGDTIQFMWGANNHTVTKSSELEICNKTSNALFASGTHDKGFMFTQVVNDTNPTFYYCGTPGHCEKGMFGIINPPSALGSPTSVSGMMPGMVQNSSDMAAMQSYTDQKCQGNSMAGSWGGNMDMGSMPGWSNSYMAQNVMYTRTFLAANPDVMDSNGKINLGASTGPLMIPQDITQALAVTGAAASGASSASAAPSTAATSSSAYPSTSAKSGAATIASSSLAVAVVAGVAAFLAL